MWTAGLPFPYTPVTNSYTLSPIMPGQGMHPEEDAPGDAHGAQIVRQGERHGARGYGYPPERQRAGEREKTGSERETESTGKGAGDGETDTPPGWKWEKLPKTRDGF